MSIAKSKNNKRIKVWTNGCFDILHIGHVKMLEYAKSIGDELVVGLDTDDKVRRTKGETRPVNTLGDRMEMISSIKYVDKVTSFDTQEELSEKIRLENPDFIVVGSDYRNKKVVGSEHCREVRFYERHGDFSTSRILGE